MRTVVLSMLFVILIAGCSSSNPVIPNDQELSLKQNQETDSPHMLWGQWQLFFSEDHETVTATPLRSAKFHLNVPKFLEEYCTNCLKITKIVKNPDKTVDVTIRITHPFPDSPEYTGFDVKGIIMFDAS